MKTLTNDTLSALVVEFAANLAVTEEHTLTIGQFHSRFVAEFGKMPAGKGTTERKLWKRAYRHARVVARKASKLEGKRTILRTVGTSTRNPKGRTDVTFAGKPFTALMAKRFVESCDGVLDIGRLIQSIKMHGLGVEFVSTGDYGVFMFESPKPVEKPVPVVDGLKVTEELKKLQEKAKRDAAKMANLQAALDALNAGPPAVQADVRETVATEASTPPVAETTAEPKASKKARKAA